MITHLNSILTELAVFVILIIAIFFRYAFFCSILEFGLDKLKAKKIFTLRRVPGQVKKEIVLSIYTSIIFGTAFTFLFSMWKSGIIRLADNSFSIHYHLASFVIAIMIHETYYYWTHRLMHHKKLYRLFHKGHHDSIEVSSWTSFAFDPLETIVQIIPFFIILCFIPLHPYVLVAFLTMMSVSGVVNHLNRHITPRFVKGTIFGRFMIGPVHHSLHHKEFNKNFGLYFTFWDKLMGTESNTTVKERRAKTLNTAER